MGEATHIKRLQSPKHMGADCMEVPPWLTLMYDAQYFDACMAHANTKKNELDRFCIDCHRALCHHCLPFHALHQYIKIRRYVYCDVINRHDLQKFFNCSGIQTYYTNKTKVLFLKQRTQQQFQQHNNSKQDHSCIICQRGLQEASLYCSIACKVSAICRGEDKGKMNDHDSPKSNKGIYKDEAQALPKRRRCRKGVPVRAPMF